MTITLDTANDVVELLREILIYAVERGIEIDQETFSKGETPCVIGVLALIHDCEIREVLEGLSGNFAKTFRRAALAKTIGSMFTHLVQDRYEYSTDQIVVLAELMISLEEQHV